VRAWLLRCSCTLTTYPRQPVMVSFQFSGVDDLHLLRTAFTLSLYDVISLQVVFSLTLKMHFRFSFAEQRVADEEETGDGKRGITYEVKKPRTSTSYFNFILFFSFSCMFKLLRIRYILSQISQNKGLTAKKKKELRNPRVKHRRKFYKAQIKRKSQV